MHVGHRRNLTLAAVVADESNSTLTACKGSAQHKAEIAAIEVADVRQDQRQVRTRHAVPARERGGDLVDRGAGDEATADVVLAVVSAL